MVIANNANIMALWSDMPQLLTLHCHCICLEAIPVQHIRELDVQSSFDEFWHDRA